MALLIYYYSTKSFVVPYKLVSGFGVMLIAAGSYYLKPTLTSFGLGDVMASALLLVAGLAAISLLTYKSILRLR